MPMNVKEAAAYLRISSATLHRLRLPRSYVGARVIYLQEDLDAYLLRQREVPVDRATRLVQRAQERAAEKERQRALSAASRAAFARQRKLARMSPDEQGADVLKRVKEAFTRR